MTIARFLQWTRWAKFITLSVIEVAIQIYKKKTIVAPNPIIYDLAFIKSNFNVFMLIFSFLFFYLNEKINMKTLKLDFINASSWKIGNFSVYKSKIRCFLLFIFYFSFGNRSMYPKWREKKIHKHQTSNLNEIVVYQQHMSWTPVYKDSNKVNSL